LSPDYLSLCAACLQQLEALRRHNLEYILGRLGIRWSEYEAGSVGVDKEYGGLEGLMRREVLKVEMLSL
jgi:hypothetical protein